MKGSSLAWKFIGCCKGSFSKQAAPPGPLRGDLADGVLQAVSDRRGHGRVEGIVAQHFFHGGSMSLPLLDTSGSVQAARLKQQGLRFPLFIFEILTSTRRLRVSG